MSLPQLKAISEWDHEYILNLPAGEFDWLDFKKSDWLTLESDCLEQLSKYLSAWANYEGGYLVIGINDPKPGEKLQPDSGVDLSTKGGIKGWLEDKLPTLVEDPILRLEVNVIPLKPKEKRGIVVVHIPASESAPHQARDRKFYTRIGSKLQPLPKRAVFDIANRTKHPNVTSSVFINLFNPDIDDRGCLVWEAVNDSDVFCRHVSVIIQIPTRYKSAFLSVDDVHFETNAEGQTYWVLRMSNGINRPLFPRDTINRKVKARLARTVTYEDGSEFGPSISSIRVRTFADSARYKDQEFSIEEVVKI